MMGSNVGAKGKEEKGRRVTKRWRDFLVPQWLVAGIDQASGRDSPRCQRSTQSATEACSSEGTNKSTGTKASSKDIREKDPMLYQSIPVTQRAKVSMANRSRKTQMQRESKGI